MTDAGWNRLSILDLLTICACIGVGYAVSRNAHDAAEAAIGGILIGSCIAGPPVLLVQVLRGSRRAKLSAGEVLWILPLVLYLLLYVSSNLLAWARVGGDWALPMMLSFLGFAMLAVFATAILRLVSGANRSSACCWTDTVGCCVAAGAMIGASYLIWNALSDL